MEDGSLLLGRLYGGCGIIFRKTLLESIKLPFKRFCAISLNLLIIIFVYFPTDYRTLVSDDDFLLTLATLYLGFRNFSTSILS